MKIERIDSPDDRSLVDESTQHGNVGDVRAPYLVGGCDAQTTQQIGVYAAFWVFPGQVPFGVNRLYSHQAHEALDPFPIDPVPLTHKKLPHLS